MFTRAPCTPLQTIVSCLSFTLLAGCAPGLFSDNQSQLDAVESNQQGQSSAIKELTQNLEAHHRGVVSNSNENTRALIETIRDQVKPPECPARPQPAAKQECPQPDQGSQASVSPRLKDMLVVGQRENVQLIEPGYTYRARIDSGANTSSMDARNITTFERNGEEWVRFDIPIPNTDGELTTLERPVSRGVRIIQASQGSDEDGESREVVDLRIAIGDRIQNAEFTLASREHLTHTVLIGRNILRDVMLIDVGKNFSLELPEEIRKAAKAVEKPKKEDEE